MCYICYSIIEDFNAYTYVKIQTGNILDLYEKDASAMICLNLDCISVKPLKQGLLLRIFNRYPQTNVLKNRIPMKGKQNLATEKTRGILGTFDVFEELEHGLRITLMYTHFIMGPPGKYYNEVHCDYNFRIMRRLDNKDSRLGHFRGCLNEIYEKIPTMKGLKKIVFPHKIAYSGDFSTWSNNFKAICNFAKKIYKNHKIKVYIVLFDLDKQIRETKQKVVSFDEQLTIKKSEELEEQLMGKPEELEKWVTGKPKESDKQVIEKPKKLEKYVMGKPEESEKQVMGKPEESDKQVIEKPKELEKYVMGKPEEPEKQESEKQVIGKPEEPEKQVMGKPEKSEKQVMGKPEELEKQVMGKPEELEKQVIGKPEEQAIGKPKENIKNRLTLKKIQDEYVSEDDFKKAYDTFRTHFYNRNDKQYFQKDEISNFVKYVKYLNRNNAKYSFSDCGIYMDDYSKWLISQNVKSYFCRNSNIYHPIIDEDLSIYSAYNIYKYPKKSTQKKDHAEKNRKITIKRKKEDYYGLDEFEIPKIEIEKEKRITIMKRKKADENLVIKNENDGLIPHM